MTTFAPDSFEARLERLTALWALARTQPSVPRCSAHLKLLTARGPRDLLLADSKLVGGPVPILDWHTAPLAEVFFSVAEGDEYELQTEERVLTGRVLEKHLLRVEAGQLLQVDCRLGSRRLEQGQWVPVPESLPAVRARPAEQRPAFRSPLDVTLDPAQQQVVDWRAGEPALVLGEAGFGKTTVALHRLLALRRKQGDSFRAAVIVPTEGLKRLTELMLARRDAERIVVETYDAWAAHTAQRVFRDLPRRLSTGARGNVVRLKRHRALGQVLQRFVKANRSPLRDEDHPAHSRALARRADLEHLFGDTVWLQQLVEASGGAVRHSAIAETVEHTRIQFSDSAETQFAHVDADRLAAVDGRALDEGTAMEDANSFDAEDAAVLFELERLRATARGKQPARFAAWDALVVDEAQELAPLELRLIGRALKPGGSLVVAGDAAQQVDTTTDFDGWGQAMADLGAPRFSQAVLEVNYRCPPDVTELARRVLKPGELPRGPETSITRFEAHDACHLSAWLVEQVARLEATDPSATLAVICRSAHVARGFVHTLQHAVAARLALDGAFEFRPGVSVTTVAEVKGLEFDYVFLPDVDQASYPDTIEARRALYVALTRATHRLALAWPRARGSSPLLR